MKTLAAFLILALQGLALAEDITTADGHVYKNVTILKVEPDGLNVETESGIEKIPFTNLPKEAQQKYNYNPTAAANFANTEAAKQAALANQQALQERKAAEDQKAANAPKPTPAGDDTSKQAAPTNADPPPASPTPTPIMEGGGGLQKIAGATVDQVATSPFTLKGALVKLTGIDRVEAQEVEAGKYELTIWGDGPNPLKATVDAKTAQACQNAMILYISVTGAAKYESTITILGNATRYEGLSTMPTVYWQ